MPYTLSVLRCSLFSRSLAVLQGPLLSTHSGLGFFYLDENGTFCNCIAFADSEIRVFNAVRFYGSAVAIIQYWKRLSCSFKRKPCSKKCRSRLFQQPNHSGLLVLPWNLGKHRSFSCRKELKQ